MSDADADNLALAQQFMDALERCDVDAVRGMYSEKVQLWHNFDQRNQTVEENLKTLRWIHRKLSDLRYDIVRREAIPGGYYQQHVLRGRLPSGAEFAMPACAIVKVENGQIVALDEYLDSRHTEPLQSSD